MGSLTARITSASRSTRRSMRASSQRCSGVGYRAKYGFCVQPSRKSAIHVTLNRRFSHHPTRWAELG